MFEYEDDAKEKGVEAEEKMACVRREDEASRDASEGSVDADDDASAIGSRLGGSDSVVIFDALTDGDLA